MQFTTHGLARVLASARASAQRMVVSGLIFLAATLLVLGKADLKIIRVTSDGLADGSLPLLELARAPVALTREAAGRLGELLAVFEENARLRAENERLLAWKHEAIELQVENSSLRELLTTPATPAARQFTSALVVADAASPFVHTRLLDAGRDRGVRSGMPVVTPEGLVGRLVGVGRRTARLMLLTDFNSRVPVVVGEAGDRAILEGDNSGEPKLRFLPLQPRIAIGDAVLTSGHGGLLPPGLMVGQVVSIDDHRVAVTPSVDWSRLDHVSILLHEPLADDAIAESGTEFAG